ncbi:DUF2161 family putative PD-(D/E)XK-type phosphodiesterase [Paenibacillus paeoniae]|uniref:Uncharacterized protein n=1 Tax=Paenibacillus paeoniae TaxID=2292705 RepID=A0A371PF05_9BACL|nr:DUF2161 family putative PD-(D/E)XK-type phosphodiesterase [Paenibacillus paeoniae]REK74523.1 hypothetical protein DX130_12530 [Paenibacillus paeoniae]
MAVQLEEEMYIPIKRFYEQRGYTVKAEVMHCDLVAIHPERDETILVEMKKTFNLALLLQGIERLRLSGDVMLAVERNRKKSGAHNQRFGDLTELCRMLGLGLMTVTFYKTKSPVIDVLCEPGEPPVRGARHRKRSKLLMEFKERSGDYNVGGSTGRKLVTAYREKALKCAYVLHMKGPSAPRELVAATGIGKSGDMLRSNYYGWFQRVERGKYALLPQGVEALSQYRDVIAEFITSYEP